MPRPSSIRVDPLTCAIGAELSGVDLGAASRDDALFTEVRALLLQYKVLFLRDQHFSHAVRNLERAGTIGDRPV